MVGRVLASATNSSGAFVTTPGNALQNVPYNTFSFTTNYAITPEFTIGGNVFSMLEDGYPNRTHVAVYLDEGATALDMGNLYEGGSARGFTNAPGSMYTATRSG